MRRKMNPPWWLPSRAIAEPRIPRRWKLFIALSTAILLALAGAIALWLPEYRPVAWALVLFSSCHASFLLVQRIGCELAAFSEGMLETAARRSNSAPLPRSRR